MRLLSKAEQELLDFLLSGDHPALAVLREQVASATSSRQLSGVGFFTHFVVADAAPRLPLRRWVIGDVGFHCPTLPDPGGALLFVEDGVVGTLEAYTHADQWHPDESDVVGFYMTRGRRSGSGYELCEVATRDHAWLADEYESAAAAG